MKHYRLKIEQDRDPQNPRTEYDNLGTLWCWHRRDSYGDEKPRSLDPSEVYSYLIGELDRSFDDREVTEEEMRDRFDDLYISLPVYAYQHGGISFSTGPFGCPWDSGRLGLIFVSKARAWKELGLTGDGWSPAQVERVHGYLKREVETYGQWVNGDVYGFTVESFQYEFEIPGDDSPVDIQDDDLDWQQEDGCWGFYGGEPTENGISDSFGSNQHPALKEAQQNLGRWVALPARELSRG